MVILLAAPLAVIVAVTAGVLQRRHGRIEGFRLVRASALSLAILFALFAGLFIVGETAQDPGGAAALALVVIWLTPMVALTAAAWRWPDPTTWVLALMVGVVVVLGVWYAIDPAWWRELEDDRGPIRGVAAFVLSLPLAVLAWHRPVRGGLALVVLGTAPGALAVLGAGGGGASGAVAAASSPASVIGALFLVAAWLERRRQADASATS
jgi:hypothetical protein